MTHEALARRTTSDRNIHEEFARVWIMANGTVFIAHQEVVTLKCNLDVSDFPFGLLRRPTLPAAHTLMDLLQTPKRVTKTSARGHIPTGR